MKIQHKRSAALDGTVAKEPTAAQTDFGEVCVNFNSADPALFIRDNADNIVRVGGDLSLYQKIDEVGSAVFVCSPSEIDGQSPPGDRAEGTLWWNTESGILYVWYEDVNSNQWVIAVPQTDVDVPPGTSVGETPPSDPEEGQLWWNSSDASEGGGRLYVYYTNANGNSQWVDTSLPGGGGGFTDDEANDLYLSKTTDDTAAGAITFQGQTTHEAGVNVTGGAAGNVDSGLRSAGLRVWGVAESVDCFNWDSKRLVFQPSNNTLSSTDSLGCFEVAPQVITTTTTNHCSGFLSNLQTSVTHTGDISHFRTNSNSARDGGSAVRTIGFHAGLGLSLSNSSDINAGFVSELDTRNSINYNFVASGSAPNYFQGNLLIAHDVDLEPAVDNTNAGTKIESRETVGRVVINMGGSSAGVNHALVARRTHPNSTADWQCIKVGNHNNSASGFIKCSGASTRIIDTRLGATGVAIADGAADIVKLLQPKVITQGGETFNGFLPADLSGTFTAAVDGEAGATTAIGTYTTPEGVEETEVEEPEAIPYGATWVQTGTRDDMQGVCREELIPLLTKALQEVITKNEELEARLAALEGA